MTNPEKAARGREGAKVQSGQSLRGPRRLEGVGRGDRAESP